MAADYTITPLRNVTAFNLSENITNFNTEEAVSLSGMAYQCAKKNETTINHWSNDPLFYIITVLMFYAFSIIILMVKYIRREKQEAEFENYYYEFVTREKFQTAQFRNAQNMCTVLQTVQYTKVSNDEEPVEGTLEEKEQVEGTLVKKEQVEEIPEKKELVDSKT